MAPADSTSSPRDHAADANPELARKKQRLSEDPGASPTGSIIIEVDEPEDIGSNMDNAIEIEDGLSVNNDPYSEDFFVFSQPHSPLHGVREQLRHIQQNWYMKTPDFIALAQALEDHEHKRSNDAAGWRHHYLDDEAEFFNTLAHLNFVILSTGDLFDPKEKVDLAAVRQAVGQFVSGTESLCRRIIPCLPDAIKLALSRRDSAHNSSRQHTINALYYVVLALPVLSSDLQTIDHFAVFDRQLHLAQLRINNRRKFSTDEITSSLAAIIRLLGGAMREIKDSWPFLQNALKVFSAVVETRVEMQEYPSDEMESAMEVVNACILPMVREKHPRALPQLFHETLIEWGEKALIQHVTLIDRSAAAKTFQLFVSSQSDALIPESNGDGSIEETLEQVCDGDHDILAKMIADSWAMQTAKSFICSDIMDIRTVGISALTNRLLAIYHRHKTSLDGFEHPEIQHAIRFLRKNETVPYIFGPESRAALIGQSNDLVTFLAATSTYTDAETDIIWRACSTSVEADFVKASFEVLGKVSQYLDFDRLIYIAGKFSTATISTFGVQPLEFLPKLLKEIEVKSSYLIEPAHRLSIAFTCIDMLKNFNCSDPCFARDRLRQIAQNAISRFAYEPFLSDDREQIYEFCIPDLLNHTVHATTSVEVLDILLQRAAHSQEAEAVYSLLPLDAAVEELCSFVRSRKQSHAPRSEILGIISRLGFLGHLMNLSPIIPESSIQEQLFTHLFGEDAFSSEARNASWDKLSTLAVDSNSSLALRNLFETFMRDSVPSLPASLATSRLIDIMQLYLRSTCRDEATKDDMTPLLSLPIWKTMVRFATTAPDDSVIRTAIPAALDMLFVYPCNIEVEPTAAVQCQREFVREHIDLLRSLNDQYVAEKGTDRLRNYLIAIDILRLTLERSKEYLSANTLERDSDVLRVDELHNEADQIKFTAHVYGINTEPNIIEVHARESSKVSELLAKLPSFTSAAENRIVVGGVEITELADKTLSEAGVRQSGVILIRPKYRFGLDLDNVLTHPGPVEQAILSEYDTLEAFLDGPDEISFQALQFLYKVQLPTASRERVVLSPATVHDLFPRDRRNRALFSLFVLKSHLNDFARLGVVDPGFILRATRLLTDFILDKERTFDAWLMFDVLSTLCLVLRERPQSEEQLEYFDKGSEFASRLFELLYKAKSLPAGAYFLPPRTPLRNELAGVTYQALILAYQNSDSVWTAFITDETAVMLHSQLLLDDDPLFSDRVSQTLDNLLGDDNAQRPLLDFYWRTIYPSLSEALSKSYWSESYFTIANKILSTLGPTQDQEPWISAIVDELRSKLWLYQHTESPPLFTGDRAILGLLRLFSQAVGILKKKHKSSRLLDGLPLQLFRRLLFPAPDDPQYRPLVQEESRGIVYDLIKSTYVVESDFHELITLAAEAAQGSVRDPGVCFPGMSDWIRPPCSASGLTNLGMTCYMNSLLQQLFGNLQFRKFILDQPIVDTNKQETLWRVQELFASMQNGIRPHTETGYLAAALNVQVGIQEDVHTFYTTLMSRLEDNMPDKESRQILTSFFTGKSITQIKGDCGHVSSREEPFTELSITVKNKASLHDSLNEFVQGEPLEGSNKYMCMSCQSENGGQLVNALRRTCLDEVPNSLTFCLKRFAFENMLDGENKVNDRFEFPAEIDLSPYKRSHLENPSAERKPDLFELVGVIVHQGSLSYGHYWSYVRVPAPQNLYRCPWMYLEDQKYAPCGGGIQEVQEQCFGGLRWSDGTERPESAYVLFYQRKGYISEADSLNSVPRLLQVDQQILPTVPVQSSAEAGVLYDNSWRVKIALLFNDQFSNFLHWLLEQYPLKLESQKDAVESLEETEQAQMDFETTSAELDARVGELIAVYALRILLPDPDCEQKLDELLKALNKVLDSRPAVATHILRHFSEDQFGCNTVVRHKSAKIRSGLFGIVEECLLLTRQEKPEDYDEIASTVIKAHASLLGNPIEDCPRSWREYLAFAAHFAAFGPKETWYILDLGYLDWLFEVLYINWYPKTKRQHPALLHHLKTGTVDRSALYEFLHDLFSEHIDLSDDAMQYMTSNDRGQSVKGWRLRQQELEMLVLPHPKSERRTGLLFEAGIHHCSPKGVKWREHAPGRLIGLLVGETVSELLSEKICDGMKIQYDVEEKELDPLLSMTLNMFSQLRHVEGGLQRAKDLMEQLCKNLLLWETRERRSLWFFREAYQLMPEAVVQSVPMWAYRFLVVSNAASRQAAADCLKDIIFGPAPIQEDSLEAARIRSTRKFVQQCQKMLNIPHERKDNRGLYECMITALKHASEYLIALQEEIQTQQEQGDHVAPRVMVEYDEAKPFVAQLVHYLDGFRDWEPVTALPTRTISVRRNVEVDDSDEYNTSDADGEDIASDASGF